MPNNETFSIENIHQCNMVAILLIDNVHQYKHFKENFIKI